MAETVLKARRTYNKHEPIGRVHLPYGISMSQRMACQIDRDRLVAAWPALDDVSDVKASNVVTFSPALSSSIKEHPEQLFNTHPMNVWAIMQNGLRGLVTHSLSDRGVLVDKHTQEKAFPVYINDYQQMVVKHFGMVPTESANHMKLGIRLCKTAVLMYDIWSGTPSSVVFLPHNLHSALASAPSGETAANTYLFIALSKPSGEELDRVSLYALLVALEDVSEGDTLRVSLVGGSPVIPQVATPSFLGNLPPAVRTELFDHVNIRKRVYRMIRRWHVSHVKLLVSAQRIGDQEPSPTVGSDAIDSPLVIDMIVSSVIITLQLVSECGMAASELALLKTVLATYRTFLRDYELGVWARCHAFGWWLDLWQAMTENDGKMDAVFDLARERYGDAAFAVLGNREHQ